MKENPRNWAVVGGGFLGMTLALRLREKGDQVTLFEAAPHLGGLADAWKVNGYTWDRHYHVTLLSDLHLRKLLEQLDLDEAMQWVETRTGFYTDGELYSMSNTVEFLKFPPLNLIDKLRLGGTIFYASKIKNWKALEKVPVTKWLRRWSGPNTFEKIWLPLLRAKLGENYKNASAAFIWAIIARMNAARRSGLKKEMFGYLEGGYDRLNESLTSHLKEKGVEIQTGLPLQTVRKKDHGFDLTFANGDTRNSFDRVAMTLPSPAAVSICENLSTEERKKHEEICYQGIVCASVLLKKKLPGYYVTNITDSWIPFTAVIEMTALVDPKNFDGHSLVYLPKYVTPDDPIFDRTDKDIEEEFVGALLKMYPDLTAEDVLAFKLSRVRNVLALSTLDYSSKLPPMETSVEGLHIINS
ncbi:MAG: NAD(P)/FAD-dependent oxidoreductase, partial [Verrucomicrobiota bacterium]